MFEGVKYFIQRGKRGYSDQDIWSFDAYLCSIIPSAIRKLENDNHGCLGDLWDSSRKNDECWKWKEILEEIAQGFEAGRTIIETRFFFIDEKGRKEIDEKK